MLVTVRAVCLIIQKSNHRRLRSSAAHTGLVLQSPVTASIIGSLSGSFCTRKFFHIVLFLENEDFFFFFFNKANTTKTASLHSAILFSRACPENRPTHVLLSGNKDCFPSAQV